MGRVTGQREVFSCLWFRLVAKYLAGESEEFPHCALETLDYVSVVALTRARELVLVRQYRPAVEDYTLELPSGHVEQGERPEDAARRELWEETGFQSGEMELLGCLKPDTGRLANRSWCFFTKGLEQAPGQGGPRDSEIEEVVLCPLPELRDWINRGTIDHAQNLAGLMLAMSRKHLVW